MRAILKYLVFLKITYEETSEKTVVFSSIKNLSKIRILPNCIKTKEKTLDLALSLLYS